MSRKHLRDTGTTALGSAIGGVISSVFIFGVTTRLFQLGNINTIIISVVSFIIIAGIVFIGLSRRDDSENQKTTQEEDGGSNPIIEALDDDTLRPVIEENIQRYEEGEISLNDIRDEFLPEKIEWAQEERERRQTKREEAIDDIFT